MSSAQSTGPIGHWTFDEGSGATAGDTSGNNLAGTVSGATWVTGKVGSGALSFNGTNSYVNVASPALLTNVNTFSWSVWLNPGASQTHSVNPIIEKGSGSNTFKSLYVTDAGSVVAEIKTASGYASSASVSGAAAAGVWAQWTVTYNDTGDRTLHIYKNGVEVAYSSQVPATTALADDTGYNMYFGATPDTAFYVLTGSIDDVQIYNRILSSAEIQSLASGGSTGGGGTTDTSPPTTPTGLSATTVSASQINLSWSASVDNVGVTGYRVYRNSVQIATVTSTTYNDTGLTASTAYSYTVAAYDAAGNVSTQSGTASATTQASAPAADTTPPSTPTGLSATTVSSSQINLSWTASTDNVGVTGYRIYRNGTQLITTAATSYQDTGLTASTAYSYTVAAYDAAGNLSPQSSAASATTQAAVTIPPPTTSSAGPVIFYTDIVTGPNTGGENNDGAYLTIFGKGFGSSQGSSYVTINNVPVAIYKQWYDNKITIQPGPSVTSGPIRVVVGGVSSNSNQTFTVVPGKIFFVSLSGNDSTGVIGDITHPFRNIQNTLNRSDFAPGDQIVVRGGNWSDVYPLYGSFFSLAYVQGTAAAPIVVMGYPTETVNLVYNGTQTRGIHSWATTGHFVIANFHMDQGGKGLAIGITPGATDVRIVNNEVKNGYEDSGGAGYIDGSGTNFKILGNVVHDNGGSKLYHAMYFDARANPSGNVEIAYNTIYNETGGRGIQIYGDTGTLINNISIHDNVIHDIHLDGILLGSYSGTGDQVYNNVVYNTANAAFQGPSTDAGSGGACLRFNSSTLSAVVYNNTFYNCAMDNGAYSAGIENQAQGSVTFSNNIINTSGGLGYFDNTSSTGGITATNNLWYGSGASPSWSANSVNANPSFVNAAGANFHLNSTSPAIDKGTSAASSLVTQDIEGTPRPQGTAYDIGAYEYASGGSTTPPPPTPAPTVSLTASPTSVTSGGSSTLSWSSSNATSCTASGAWSGSKATSGSQSLTNLTTTATYTLSCTGSGGTTSQSATITVTAPAPDTTPPSTPTGLSATAVSSSQVNLSWSASTDPTVTGQTTSGLSGYRIYRSGVQIGTSPTTSFSNTGLASGTTYSYTVAAVDVAGNVSTQSAAASATTQTVTTPDTTPPTVALSAPANGATVSGTVAVSATAADNVGVVGVQFKLDGANLGAEDTTAPYSVSWNTTSATNGTHTLTAVARDAAGNTTTATARTVTVSNTTPDTTPPTISITAPTSAATYTASTASVTVGGTAADNVGVTSVTWSNAAGGSGTAAGTTAWSASVSLQAGTNLITVTARDAAGNTTHSTITITYSPTVSDTLPPSVPLGLSGAAPSVSEVDLSWSAATDNVGVTGYKVSRNGTQIATVTTTTYQDLNLSPFTTYTYTVAAYDAAGNVSTASSPVSVTTQSQAAASSGSSGGSGGGGGGGSTAPSSGGGGGSVSTPPPPSSSTGSSAAGSSGASSAGSTGTTSGPHPSGLTDAQIQAILNLLSSFGADSATVANIHAILTGTALATTPASSSTLSGTGVSFTRNLYQGLQSADVTKLQQFLATDPSLYPEALITGYYGSLTTKAVERFQAKYGIVSSGSPTTTGYGVVGPQTRAKLNALEGQ